MKSLLITAETPHGVVLSRPWGISLDGLLASVIWHRRKHAVYAAGGAWSGFDPREPPEVLELPLQRCGTAADLDWHWAATFCELHPHSDQPDVRWRTRRTDHVRLQQLAPSIGVHRVSDQRGRYQSRVVPVLAHPATQLTWRAVGDPAAIEDLLEDLPAIGKYTGSGEGVVTSWTVAPCPEISAWSAGHEHQPGVLGRAVPQRCLALEGARAPIEPPQLRNTAIRAPYLHPASRFEALLPQR